jgi:hypothetical protein
MEPVRSLPCSQEPCSLVPALSQLNPVHTKTPYFCKFDFNFNLLHTLSFSKQLLTCKLPTEILFFSNYLCACYMENFAPKELQDKEYIDCYL